MSKKKYANLIVWGCCLIPGYWIGWLFLHNDLGANPVEKLEHISGDWAINFLMASLAITPVMKILKVNKIFFLRKIFGLVSFYYAIFHFSVYLVFDVSLKFSLLVKDITKRPYITAGFICLLILAVMAVTSQRKWLQVAPKSWKKIHKAVYGAAVFSILHYIWLVKADNLKPLLYGVIAFVLLVIRSLIYTRIRQIFVKK